jgi:hypothetical protein
LKVTDEKSRIRIRIRIRKSVVRIRGSSTVTSELTRLGMNFYKNIYKRKGRGEFSLVFYVGILQ